VVSLSVFTLGTVLALIWYLAGRIDRLDDRVARLDERLIGAVNRLAEDFAVLKGMR
jgi:hypothetical protein